MATTKTILGITAAFAAGALACILAITSNKRASGYYPNTDHKHNWNENSTSTFTGWLVKLRKAVDDEMR